MGIVILDKIDCMSKPLRRQRRMLYTDKHVNLSRSYNNYKHMQPNKIVTKHK